MNELQNRNNTIEYSNNLLDGGTAILLLPSGETEGIAIGQKENLIDFYNLQAEKEEFYIIAIKNLIKKNKYLQLTLQFKDELVDKAEYVKEIENNEDTYVIKTNNAINEKQLKVLSEIVDNVGEVFVNSEISELFSVSFKDSNRLIQYISTLTLPTK